MERLWGTFQDRLVSELRLAGAKSIDEASEVLGAFLPRFNERFAVPAAVEGSAYRLLPTRIARDEVFCFKYLRTVAADNTVQLGEHRLQLLPGRNRISYAKAKVEVHERMDGSLAVYYHGEQVAAQSAPLEAPVLRARGFPRPPAGESQSLAAIHQRARQTQGGPPAHENGRPTKIHPWKHSFVLEPSGQNH